ADGGAGDRLPPRAPRPGRGVLQGSRRAGGWKRVSAYRIVEFPRIRSGLRHIEHVPGDGKHDSLGGVFRGAHSPRLRAGNLALTLAGISAELDMVSLGWRGLYSARDQHAAAAPRV